MRGFVLLAFAAFALSASGQYTDTECWVGTGVGQSLNKTWSWSLQWENRWSQGASWHEQGLVDAAVEYRVNKHWDLNMQWRFSERQQLDGGYAARRRIALRAIGSWKVGPGKWSTRIMTTEDWDARPWFSGVRPEGQAAPLMPTVRSRVAYGRKVADRLDAELSWEVFHRQGGRWSERWQASLGTELSKRWDVELAYLWGNEWLDPDPWRSHVLRIQTSYTLRKPDQPFKRIPSTRVYAEGQRTKLSGTCPVCTAQQIRITEIHAKGEPADYIEVQNASDAACSLTGWRLTDDLTQVGWELPGGCLPPGAVVLGYENGRGGFPFGLSASGETLFLLDSVGDVKRQIQVLPTVENRAQGPGNSGNWSSVEPSPGKVKSDN